MQQKPGLSALPKRGLGRPRATVNDSVDKSAAERMQKQRPVPGGRQCNGSILYTAKTV